MFQEISYLGEDLVISVGFSASLLALNACKSLICCSMGSLEWADGEVVFVLTIKAELLTCLCANRYR